MDGRMKVVWYFKSSGDLGPVDGKSSRKKERCVPYKDSS